MSAFHPLPPRENITMGAPMENDLYYAACAICIEVWNGRWNEALSKVHNGQPAGCPQVIEELARRCPGFTRDEYQHAIATGMHDTK